MSARYIDINEIVRNMPCEAVSRFEQKVSQGHTSECWCWLAAVDRHGYGHFGLMGYHLSAHRVAYALWKGEIPVGVYVLHSCDNRLCCNPGHLFLGTHADNMRDMRLKGRASRGEKNFNAKLSYGDACTIRKLVQSGVSRKTVSETFGISKRNVSYIMCGQRWKHV